MKFKVSQTLASLCLGAALISATAAFAASVTTKKASAPTPAPTSAQRPKLVVFIAIDGLPQRQVLNYRDQLAPDGFARFLERGTWFANAHYAHGFTITCPGHATMLSGAYPHRSGIIGNDWRDAQTGLSEYCAGDTSATYIGHTTRPLDGTSPKNLKVETVGDMLRRANPQSKVIGISAKDRGAIMPAGKTGTAYIYMQSSGQFASTTYYMKEHPAWVNAFNAKRPADRYFKAEWKALLPEAAYARSLPDNQVWFGPAGGALPMRYGALEDTAPGLNFYSSLIRGPYADALTLEFARAALQGEGLGQGKVPDLLAVSLSGHDYVNHAFSAESRLSHDHVLQLDLLLQSFFADLDARIGKDNYVVALTADHGFMPAVGYSAQQGVPTGNIDSRQALANINLGLQSQFGPGTWVTGYSGSSLLLNKALIAQRGADAAALAEATRNLLLAQPGFAVAYTRQELQSGSRAGAPYFDALEKAWHPTVSGDVQYAIKPHWGWGSRGTGAIHGSPYEFDSHVPILLYGPAWIGKGRIDKPVEVVDIAPTLAALLGIAPPPTSEGHVLPFAPLAKP
ncbi:MAG: alkaline phosphatase [Burkholderiales bacterium PBB3]|nr:MAG: alkaline phosphatase [Burkholderiales bacterium PBB3]